MSMKKQLGLIFGICFLLPSFFTKVTAFKAQQHLIASAEGAYETLEEIEPISPCVSLAENAKAAYLMDYASGTEIYARGENNRLPIASMCKIMTLILCFDAIEEGTLSLEESVHVSEHAASMGGSQVFLEANASYPVSELIKSIIVCSANDSCVAMAERLAGSDTAFTDRMNERAKELSAENTLFANCTGLPKEPQYSCAKDVALFLKELVSHEEYFSFSKIWTDKFEHPKGRFTEISNTNRLVRFYEGCDGGKTGFTNQAGFCLAATAKRGGMRLISVVIGEDSSANRFDDIKGMFDYAFGTYTLKTVVDENNPLDVRIEVRGGKTTSIAVRPARSSHIFSERGKTENVGLETKLDSYVKAPVKAGDKVGEIVVYKDNVEIDRVDVVAHESAEKAGFMDYLRRIGSKWNF